MLTFLCPLLFAAPPTPTIDLDTLTLADVRQFDGKAVTGLFTAVAPCYTWRIGGKIATITGPDDKNDGAEWSVVLKGNRLHDVGEGDRLKVRGVLHVINHPAVVVNGVLIPRYNVAPSLPIPVVRIANGVRELVQLIWGLVPHWQNKPKPVGIPNARAETLLEKPTFRDPFRSRRCLVPIDGFFEWKTIGKKKHPYHFRPTSCVQPRQSASNSSVSPWRRHYRFPHLASSLQTLPALVILCVFSWSV